MAKRRPIGIIVQKPQPKKKARKKKRPVTFQNLDQEKMAKIVAPEGMELELEHEVVRKKKPRKKKRPPTIQKASDYVTPTTDATIEIPPEPTTSSMVPASETVPDVPYRYRKTPDVFYVRPKTVTPDVLYKRLMKRYQALGGRDMSLLYDLKRFEDPVVLYRVRRGRTDRGDKYERKETVVVEGKTLFRQLKNTPGYS